MSKKRTQLTKLSKMTHEENGNINKETETMKRKQTNSGNEEYSDKTEKFTAGSLKQT